MKHLLLKTGGTVTSPAFLEGSLAYHLTPRDRSRSPSELVFGQTMRSRLPVLTEARLSPPVTVPSHVEKAEVLAEKSKIRADKRSRVLHPLCKGERFWVQSQADGRWRKTGVIERVGPKRDYWICMDQGGRVLRNR